MMCVRPGSHYIAITGAARRTVPALSKFARAVKFPANVNGFVSPQECSRGNATSWNDAPPAVTPSTRIELADRLLSQIAGTLAFFLCSREALLYCSAGGHETSHKTREKGDAPHIYL